MADLCPEPIIKFVPLFYSSRRAESIRSAVEPAPDTLSRPVRHPAAIRRPYDFLSLYEQGRSRHEENRRRVVVHGSTFPLEWLKLTIDTNANAPASANAFGPFSWQRMTQS